MLGRYNTDTVRICCSADSLCSVNAEKQPPEFSNLYTQGPIYNEDAVLQPYTPSSKRKVESALQLQDPELYRCCVNRA